MRTLETTVYKAPQLRFTPEDVTTEQVLVTSKDGTRVPLFLSYKKGLMRDGAAATLLYGYGGFNISLLPGFSPSRILWMERGACTHRLVCAGAVSTARHQAGTRLNKQNVFDDFAACAEWLIAQKYTSAAKLAIQGGSNGGLLVGASLTQRPELFGAAIAEVGVLDMLRFDKFMIGWAWKPEYGLPRKIEQSLRPFCGIHRSATCNQE